LLHSVSVVFIRVFSDKNSSGSFEAAAGDQENTVKQHLLIEYLGDFDKPVRFHFGR